MKFTFQIFLLFTLGNTLLANSSNPPSGYHGESLNCTSCHGGNSVNSGDGGISLSGLPTSYVPGQTYNLALTVSGTHARGYGFQLSPKINGNLGGQLTAVSNDMGIESDSAEHRGSSLTGTWNFQWTAPSTDEGSVTFYASGLATGGSSGNDGDYVYTMSQNLAASSFTHASMDWNASTSGVIFSSPTIGTDGAIYIGSNDNQLHAFNPDGTTKWTFPAGNWVDSTPAVGVDGTIYVGSWDNKLYAINPNNGQKIWEYATNSNVIASPAVGADGKIYVGSKDSIFYAFESNGSVAWEYFAGQPITASAALGQDGTIYFGDENGSFHAVNSDGSSKWTYQVDNVADSNNSILSSAALDLSGNIYFGSGNGYCYSISDNETNASLNWKFLTGDRVDTSPVLGINDDIFFVSRDGYLRSLSTLSGGVTWDAFVGDVFYSSPVVDENGRTYVIGYTGGGQNHLFAFDANGTKAWDTNETECPFSIGGIVDSSLTLSSNGKLYYGCYDNRIYCVDVGTGPAPSDWPMFQRNQRRDGSWPSYLLDILIFPVGAGTISGAGVYNQGATASVSVASTANGYTFENWSGASTGSATSLNLVMNSNLSLTANFALSMHSLIVNTTTGGTVTGSGSIQHGSDRSITATPSTGYSFTGWTGASVSDSTAPNTTINMTQAQTVTANFTLNSYTVNAVIEPTNSGSVSGIGTYNHGDTVTLTASSDAENGYRFINWTGSSVGTENPLTFQIDSNVNLTATFDLNTYPLTVTASTGGTVTGAGNIPHGTLTTITAIPDTGYLFTGWSGGGITDTASLSTSVNMTEARAVTANFSPKVFTISGTVLPEGSGQVSGVGFYEYGQTATLSASTLLEGYSFENWSGDLNGSENPVNITVDSNLSITVNFGLKTYTLELNSSLGGSVSGSGNFNHGTQAVISASPATGFSFTGWGGQGIADYSSPVTSVNMTADRNISAQFSPNLYELTLLAGNGGSVSGEGNFSHGEMATISANPKPGYTFNNWNGEGIVDSSSLSTSVEMNQSRSISALFSINYHQLTVTSSAGGTVLGEGNYSYGQEVVITALPEEGYTFTGWSGDLQNNLTSPSTSVSIDGNKSIHATFSLIPDDSFVLTMIANPTSSGTTQGGASYPRNSLVTISASPLVGYEFISWGGMGVVDSNSSTTQVSLSENLTITANFKKKTFTLEINESNGGTTIGAGSYEFGTNANISATALPGYTFSNWTGGGVFSPGNASTEVLITENRTVTANFTIQTRSLVMPPTTGGTVSGAGTYEYGTIVEVTANPLPGYTFEKWSGNAMNNPLIPSTILELTEDMNVTASFTRNLYSLETSATVGGSVSTGGKYYYGYTASLSALAADGYEFTRWEGGTVANSTIPFTTTSMTEDRNVTAVFTVKSLEKSLQGTTEIAPSWYDSSWFGIFFQNDSGWAYHLHFGWIYPVVSDSSNIWFWHNKHGWIWAAQVTFADSFLWSETSGGWWLWDNTSSESPRYYNYSIPAWMDWNQ